MAEIKIKFDLAFSRRFVAVVGAAAVMLSAVAELGSESVTLTTYYPAPSGVYTKMITTGDTHLARDGGRVGIGTAALGTAKLTINGTAVVNDSLTLGRLAADPPGANGMIYYNTTTDRFRGFRGGAWWDLNVGGPQMRAFSNGVLCGAWSSSGVPRTGTRTATCGPGYQLVSCASSTGDMGENSEYINLQPPNFAAGSCTIFYREVYCPMVYAYCMR